ncbi:MAG: ACT domain-containing protein [Candidatus Micrarchaeia archaeon]
MKVLKIVEKDRVGLMADIALALSEVGINIENISATGVQGKAVIVFEVREEEEDKAVDVLTKKGYKVLSEEMILIKLRDKPGELARISKMLKDRKVNFTNLQVMSRDGKETLVGLTVEQPEEAKRVLREFIVK